MKISILVTGEPPKELSADFSSYAAMFQETLGNAFDFTTFDLRNGNFPEASKVDGCIITGSAACVHDSRPWILELKRWLLRWPERMPLVGICFGHQVLAEAFGGRVSRCAKGWQGGLRTYRVTEPTPLVGWPASFTLPIAHEDQVVEKPQSARVIASHPECRHSTLLYSDRNILSFQAHPEFHVDYNRALIDLYDRLGLISSTSAQSARLSLTRQRPDSELVTSLIQKFLRSVSPGMDERFC